MYVRRFRLRFFFMSKNKILQKTNIVVPVKELYCFSNSWIKKCILFSISF